jgi:hypothetical protein
MRAGRVQGSGANWSQLLHGNRVGDPVLSSDHTGRVDRRLPPRRGGRSAPGTLRPQYIRRYPVRTRAAPRRTPIRPGGMHSLTTAAEPCSILQSS